MQRGAMANTHSPRPGSNNDNADHLCLGHRDRQGVAKSSGASPYRRNETCRSQKRIKANGDLGISDRGWDAIGRRMSVNFGAQSLRCHAKMLPAVILLAFVLGVVSVANATDNYPL